MRGCDLYHNRAPRLDEPAVSLLSSIGGAPLLVCFLYLFNLLYTGTYDSTAVREAADSVGLPSCSMESLAPTRASLRSRFFAWMVTTWIWLHHIITMYFILYIYSSLRALKLPILSLRLTVFLHGSLLLLHPPFLSICRYNYFMTHPPTQVPSTDNPLGALLYGRRYILIYYIIKLCYLHHQVFDEQWVNLNDFPSSYAFVY